jgi:hypothetical protein
VVIEDLLQRAAAVMLADDVLGDALLGLRPRREKRERALDRIDEAHAAVDCIVAA